MLVIILQKYKKNAITIKLHTKPKRFKHTKMLTKGNEVIGHSEN